MPRRPDSLAVLSLLTMLTALGPISTDLYLPALPTIEEAFRTNVATVQLTLTVYLIGFAFFQLLFGPVSDRFGRRPVLLGGTAIYCVASIGCMVAPRIDVLIGFRFLQAVGASAGVVLCRAIVRDLFEREQAARVLSYMGTAMALAPALGPIVGGYLTVAFGWRANFLLITAFASLALLGVIFLLEETNRHLDPGALRLRTIAGNFRHLLGQRRFLGYLLASSASYSGLFAFISGSSFVFIRVLGLTPDRYGYCFATVILGYMTGTQIGGRLTMRLGVTRLVVAGCLLDAAAGAAMLGLAMAGITSVAAVLAPMVVYMAGMGLVLPNAMAGAIAPFPRQAGAVSSVVGFAQYGIASLVGLAVGHAFDQSQVPMVSAIAIMGVAALASCVLLARPGRGGDMRDMPDAHGGADGATRPR